MEIQIRITEVYESNEGIRFSGIIPRPEPEHIARLHNINTTTKIQRAEPLRQWNGDFEDQHLQYLSVLEGYSRLHLGLAQLTQEDEEE